MNDVRRPDALPGLSLMLFFRSLR